MSESEIKVPNIGDFKDVEVIEVLVSEGQILKKNDPLITIESDKSSVEIPSNFDGKIKSLKIKVGDKVSEGDLILTLESISETPKQIQKKPIIEKDLKKVQINEPEVSQTFINQNKVTDISSASPKVRKFARELGVDINQVKGSERGGRVIETDVKLFVATKSNLTSTNKIKNDEKIKQD
jgi:pyruvate dehydrogenase E2 component (dihydrolipoamide acetyltransferase)